MCPCSCLHLYTILIALEGNGPGSDFPAKAGFIPAVLQCPEMVCSTSMTFTGYRLIPVSPYSFLPHIRANIRQPFRFFPGPRRTVFLFRIPVSAFTPVQMKTPLSGHG